MTMVEDQKNSPRSGDERAGRKFGSTVTSIWRVTARYMRADFRKIRAHHSEKLGRNQSAARHPRVQLAVFPIVVSKQFRPIAPATAKASQLAWQMRAVTLFSVAPAPQCRSVQTVPDDVRCRSNCRTASCG